MDKRYFAFISYKREDLKDAEWLRKKLSHYHFPTKLRKENEELPKSIRPVFRDSLELTGGFLAKEIKTALSESKYLIVICSPRSAKSPWVNKEVQYFIDNGHEKYIIPFVVEGEPFSEDLEKECFPPALKSLQGEKEILAININELGKNAAAIKVVARMFSLRFDTLWQGYNREQKRKRWVWAILLSFLVMLSIFVSGWFYKANKELIERQDKLLVTQSRYLSSEAEKEYEKGNITKALRMALYALPKNLDNPDRPYVPEAELKLRQCNYPQKYNIYSKSILKHDDFIYSAVFSPDGKYIVTASGDKTARVWDAATGKPAIEPLKHDGNVFSAVFSPDGKYIVTASDDKTARVWDAATGKPMTEPLKHDDSVYSAVFSPDGKYIVTVSDDNTARVWDAATGKPLTEPLKHDDRVESAVFSPDGKYIVTASDDNTARVWPFPSLQELIDKYRKDPEHDWSLTEEEKKEYSLE